MNYLQEEELNELQEMEVEEAQRFRIDGIEKLNWVFKKLNAIAAKEKEVNQLKEAEIQRIEKWAEKEMRDLNNAKEFFEEHVKEYHLEQLRINPKQKSISTPYGKVKSLRKKASVVKRDELELLRFLEEYNQEFIKVDIKHSVKWADLKKTLSIVEGDNGLLVVDEYGGIIKGVEIEPENITFKVEVDA